MKTRILGPCLALMLTAVGCAPLQNLSPDNEPEPTTERVEEFTAARELSWYRRLQEAPPEVAEQTYRVTEINFETAPDRLRNQLRLGMVLALPDRKWSDAERARDLLANVAREDGPLGDLAWHVQQEMERRRQTQANLLTTATRLQEATAVIEEQRRAIEQAEARQADLAEQLEALKEIEQSLKQRNREERNDE